MGLGEIEELLAEEEAWSMRTQGRDSRRVGRASAQRQNRAEQFRMARYASTVQEQHTAGTDTPPPG